MRERELESKLQLIEAVKRPATIDARRMLHAQQTISNK